VADYWEGGEQMLRRRAAPYPMVLLDVDTQRDFLEPSGARPVANLESLLPNLRQVFAWVRRYRIKVISSLDVHRPTEPRSDGVPIHCLEGTEGVTKVPISLLKRRIFIQADNTIDLPYDLLSKYQQVLFTKRGNDLTSNPKADRLLTEIQAEDFIICGVGLEESIRPLALTLLGRKRSVWLVADACGFWDERAADLTIRQLEAKGVRILTARELVRIVPPKPQIRRFRYTGLKVKAPRPNHLPDPASN